MGEVAGAVFHRHSDMSSEFYNYSELNNLQNETNLEGINVVLFIILCYIKFGGVLYSFF